LRSFRKFSFYHITRKGLYFAVFGAIYVDRVESQLRRTDIPYAFSGGAELDWYFERLSWITYQLRMAKLV